MLARTHVAIGILAALLAKPLFAINNTFVFVLLVCIGALLPDVDHGGSTINRMVPVTTLVPLLFRHRGFFHSIFAALILFGTFSLFNQLFVGAALAFGYALHLLADSFTKQGVNWLYPLSTFRMAGPIETGELAETILFVFVIIFVLVRIEMLI